MLRRLVIILLFAASAVGTTGCQSASRRESVKPGINERYRDPDLNVQEWVERFEGESREVYTCRHDIVKAINLKAGTTVADVGAGTGLFEPLLANEVTADGRVIALDIVPKFVDHINERAAEQGLRQVEARLCSEDSIDMPEASVDVIFSSDTYHHFEYPDATLASMYAALKPEGRLYLLDFEREEGVSREWILGHVRAGKDEVIREVTDAGFILIAESTPECLAENYLLEFARP